MKRHQNQKKEEKTERQGPKVPQERDQEMIEKVVDENNLKGEGKIETRN